jgi:hypothetical protein
MTTKNGITVEFVRSNEPYDIFRVLGVSTDELTEQPDPIYVERKRGEYTESDVLNDCTN